ncbi:deoxyribodipyrimidine photo-lyase [Pseudomonas sp. BBP2017]|uniref:deoxyribodipyrimidine photo-lyase n=1 Tax=Pseudomonas sp. BBP2017 TaxID=2109731 RepID=UPI000D119E29|nr:deoxyribodipyrimidine photo-lyase [Pseudomonas sp. BBP2017]PSS58756.1 deoxyribodipyrimidine photo-lyase [Pseudomonas sp. BBP2017]
MQQLMWFRNDLRVQDNTALTAAMQAGSTLAVFLISPGQWRAHDDAPCKVDFWLRNLVALRAQLQALNVPLLIRQAEHWRDAPAVLATLCREQSIASVQVNQEYGVHETLRDREVANQLAELGVGFHSHLDQLLFQPGSILTRSGSYFQVFSQFRKVCYQRLHTALPAQVARPHVQARLTIDSDTIPTSLSDFTTPNLGIPSLWPAGEAVAQERLQRFAEEQLHAYDRQRDFPVQPGTSQLSPYLAAGVLSPRQCLHAALSCNQGEFEAGSAGAVTWINELLWREFYKHILVGFSRVSRHRAFRPTTEALPWRHAPQELAAWQQGRTGFPLIDAAMRQLLATGWMHNRLRMVVAMFLTKNLLIDWREGERFFMRHLIDGDLAANNGGWQWSASTGTDAVPWFRLFNPINQSRRFDPDGRFIRHWLPELADLDNRSIHAPAALGGLFSVANYPQPIVDLVGSRQRALQAFRDLPLLERLDD